MKDSEKRKYNDFKFYGKQLFLDFNENDEKKEEKKNDVCSDVCSIDHEFPGVIEAPSYMEGNEDGNLKIILE